MQLLARLSHIINTWALTSLLLQVRLLYWKVTRKSVQVRKLYPQSKKICLVDR
jgi:hypothetical protein